MDFDYDFLVLGSGPAGQRAAVQAAKLGKRVAIVERRQMVGGVSLHVGTLPSKTFREAVVSLTHVPSLSSGIPVERPRATIADLLYRVRQVIERELDVVARQLSRNGVDLLIGSARFVDPHRVAPIRRSTPLRASCRATTSSSRAMTWWTRWRRS